MSKYQPSWEGDATLHSYCYDYMRKRGWFNAASAFAAEAGLSEENWRGPPIEAPQGLLFEWWTVFWDIFVATQKGAARNPSAAAYADHLRTRKETSTVHFLGQNPQPPIQLPRSMAHPRFAAQSQMSMSDPRAQHPQLVQRVPSSQQLAGPSMYAAGAPGQANGPSSTQYTPKMANAFPGGMAPGSSPQQQNLNAISNGRGGMPPGYANVAQAFPPSESVLTSPAFLEGMRAMGYGNRPPESLTMEEKNAVIRFIRKPQTNAVVGPLPGPHTRQPSHPQQGPGQLQRMPSRQDFPPQRPPSHMAGAPPSLQERQLQQQQQHMMSQQQQPSPYASQNTPSSPAYSNSMGPPQNMPPHASPSGFAAHQHSPSGGPRRHIPTPINVSAAQKRPPGLDNSPRSAKRTRSGQRLPDNEELGDDSSPSGAQYRGPPPPSSSVQNGNYDPQQQQQERPPSVLARPASALANEYIPTPDAPRSAVPQGASPGQTPQSTGPPAAYEPYSVGQASQQYSANGASTGRGPPPHQVPTPADSSGVGAPQAPLSDVPANAGQQDGSGDSSAAQGVSDGLFDFPPDLLTNDFSFDSFIDHSMFPDENAQLT